MRTVTLIFASLLLLTFRNTAVAQMDKPVVTTGPLTGSQVVDSWIANTETHVIAVAGVMPGDKYSFAPSNGAFKGVRTFGEQLKHLAANNYRMAAKIRLQKPSADQENEEGPDSIKTKAEILEYVTGSFTALHRAVATINEKNEAEPLAPSGIAWQRARLGFAIDAVAHSFDHYGQLVEYLRMNGIIPPGSR